MDAAIVDRIARALAEPSARILLAGRSGTGRGTAVVALCTTHGRSVMRIDLARVIGDPRAADVHAIAARDAALGDMAVVLSVIDNLVKGASGQAVQNMNIMFDLPETTGLTQVALLP